jgi:RNA polymerase sigma-70 factor (ECF subfamily)
MNRDLSILIDQHAEKGYGFALRLTRNEQNAHDLVQQTLTKVLTHFKTYDHARPFAPWFNRILKNVFLDGVRKIEHRLMVSLDAPSPIEGLPWTHFIAGSDPTPLEQLEHKEMAKAVRTALSLLPAPYNAAVTLCDVERNSYRQIAKILDCPIGTVRSRIHQGRIMLRDIFFRARRTPSL